MSFGPTNSTPYGQDTGQYRHGRTLATRDEPHPSSPRIAAAALGSTMSDDRVPPTPPLPFLSHEQHSSAYFAHASMPQVRGERVYTSLEVRSRYSSSSIALPSNRSKEDSTFRILLGFRVVRRSRWSSCASRCSARPCTTHPSRYPSESAMDSEHDGHLNPLSPVFL